MNQKFKNTCIFFITTLIVESLLGFILFVFRRVSYYFSNGLSWDQMKIGFFHGGQFILLKIPVLILLSLVLLVWRNNESSLKRTVILSGLNFMLFVLLMFAPMMQNYGYIQVTGSIISIVSIFITNNLFQRRRINLAEIIDDPIERSSN